MQSQSTSEIYIVECVILLHQVVPDKDSRFDKKDSAVPSPGRNIRSCGWQCVCSGLCLNEHTVYPKLHFLQNRQENAITWGFLIIVG